MESLRMQRQALKERIAQLTQQADSLRLDVEELKLQAADDQRKLGLMKGECDEWRRKYKEEGKVGEKRAGEA